MKHIRMQFRINSRLVNRDRLDYGTFSGNAGGMYTSIGQGMLTGDGHTEAMFTDTQLLLLP